MRPSIVCLATAAALALASGAQPASAITLPVEIEYRIEIATLAPMIFTGSGFATVNGSGPGGHLQSLAIAAGQVVDTTLVAVTDPGAMPITGVLGVLSNGAGTVAETVGGIIGGVIPSVGYAKVCLFGLTAACATPTANLTVPLTPVGAGGFAVETAAVNLTVLGVPWTTGQAAIGTITRMGFAHGPASAPSSTAQPGGVVQLVTPLYITTNISASAVVPIFATLTLRFVPEPTSLVLLAAGIAGLAAAGRRKRSG